MVKRVGVQPSLTTVNLELAE